MRELNEVEGESGMKLWKRECTGVKGMKVELN